MQSDILSMNAQLPALANSKPPLEKRSGASKSTLIFLPLSLFEKEIISPSCKSRNNELFLSMRKLFSYLFFSTIKLLNFVDMTICFLIFFATMNYSGYREMTGLRHTFSHASWHSCYINF